MLLKMKNGSCSFQAKGIDYSCNTVFQQLESKGIKVDNRK
jgi:hypothetical protein